MSDYTYHAVSSANAFGGEPADYYDLHRWIDRSRGACNALTHRMLSHHTQGIQDAIRVFGDTITNSQGRNVSVQLLAHQHIHEDLGFVPTFDHYIELLYCPRWVSRRAKLLHSKIIETIQS